LTELRKRQEAQQKALI